MAEPLSKDHFEAWREREFVPHIEAEQLYEKKVDKIETQLSMWLKIVSIGMFFGGAALAIFLWVLLEKNNQIGEMQKAIIGMNAEHKQVLVTLEQHGRRLTEQGEQARVVTTALIDLIKQQADYHSGDRRK